MDELWREVCARIDEADLDGLADLLAGAGDGARAALPPLLAAGPRPGLAGLIDLAVAAARAGGRPPGPPPAIPGLAAAATGRTALAAAAKRLVVLTACGAPPSPG
ncbi:hypothetical protein ABT297_38085 [Dactylosporangium sp. NPDC000555]|uniref:hypothetical protein n=1 Tax=Dactylosporangium sp. NPDC000555 TaxID=3154260 RepID=UPI00331EE83D